MCIAHQHYRLAAARPSEDLETILIVEVMGSLALRDIAPCSGDMAGSVNVLQEMQRESLVRECRLRQGRSLPIRELLVRQPAGLL